MENEAGVEKIQSSILSEDEVGSLLEESQSEESVVPEVDTSDVKLPSEEVEAPEQTVEELQKQIEELKAKLDNPETKPEPNSALVEEYISKYQDQGGALSEEDYQALASKGYSKEFVDTYIDGMNAKVNAEQEARVAALSEPYGGLGEVQKAIQWAKDAWSDADKQAFNESIATGDESVQKLLVASLMREYGVASTKAPEPSGPIHSNTTPPQPSKGYETKSAMMKDMADPRYKSDPSFNAAVQKKVLATDQSKWYGKITSL